MAIARGKSVMVAEEMGQVDAGSDRAGRILVKAEPFNAETLPAALSLPQTPTLQHYVRSHFAIPEHDGTLLIDGAVERPLTLTLADLRGLPATTLDVTLECAGNGRIDMVPLPPGEPWAGTAVGTATWTGVPLATVMQRAGVRTGAVELKFVGADHGPHQGQADCSFMRSLPLESGLRPEARVLLAYAMNGAALRPEHGGPLRLIVPNWYGMASVKWLTRIEAMPERFEGPFQTEAYVYEGADGAREPVTLQRVKALITDPADGSSVSPGHLQIRGKTWSGSGPVTRVEVSTDAGVWREAQLEPPASAGTWQPWSFAWEVTEAGRHTVRVRASDAAGNVQPDLPAWNRRGYGNNATQVFLVEVRSR